MTKRPLLMDLAIGGGLKEALNMMDFPNFGKDAACDGLDTEIFFEDTVPAAKKAKEICSSCPLKTICAEWGIRYENHGVWGGLSAKERFLMRGGKDAIEPLDLTQAAKDYQIIMFKPLEEISQRFNVAERTVIRWKEILKQAA